jgi:hypothetical protein
MVRCGASAQTKPIERESSQLHPYPIPGLAMKSHPPTAAGFCSTDFSLCAFDLVLLITLHRLKSVLLTRVEPRPGRNGLHSLHASGAACGEKCGLILPL